MLGGLELGVARCGPHGEQLRGGGGVRGEREIGGVVVGLTPYGAPLYLRDVVDIVRSYDNPPAYLEFYRWKDEQGNWQRTRSVSLSVQMGAGKKSIALTVRLQPVDKTLTEAEIEAVSARIIDKVTKATGGALRG